MSLEQFLLPPREWCESKLNENRRYFHLFSQKTVEPIDDEITRLNLTEKDRLLLLYLFCRSIAFYQYSIKKA